MLFGCYIYNEIFSLFSLAILFTHAAQVEDNETKNFKW